MFESPRLPVDPPKGVGTQFIRITTIYEYELSTNFIFYSFESSNYPFAVKLSGSHYIFIINLIITIRDISLKNGEFDQILHEFKCIIVRRSVPYGV